MEKFHEGDFNNGCALIHDFFDNNIYLYFENPRQSSFVQLEQKKEEYKMAIGHSTLQKVAVALKCFLLEIASKLLEETLRWAQLNHHETEVQYCLLYKGKLMEKLGDNRLHFTYVEDALVKAQSFNNYALQLHSCMHHIAMELFYDLNKLRKDIGQNRILNSGFIINNAFVKLLSEYKPRKILMQSQLDLYSIRSLMLGQRKDFLHELGFKKKNLFKTQDPIKALFHSSEDPNTMYSDFVHLEALLDEDTSLFYDQWYAFMDGKNNQLKEYQLSFFDAYFQVKILLRRKDLETISTYYRIMEKILALFPEALLLFKFWSLRIEILIAKECYEQAFVSVNFLMKEMQREGYSKQLFLEQKYKVAAIYKATGKQIKAFEELNSAISKAKEHSLNDLYVKCKLLQVQLYFQLGFSSKCLSVLRKICSKVMLSSNRHKLEHKELEVKVCLHLVKNKIVDNSVHLFRRVIQLAKEGVQLAIKLEDLKSVKQLLFIKAKVYSKLNEVEERNNMSLACIRLNETEQFIRDNTHKMLSLDDKLLCSQVNRQISDLLCHVIKVN